MIYVLIILFLGGLRFHQLTLKPVHHDESINGNFVAQVFDQAWFNYDPTNYHGPLLFYLFAFAERCFGWGIYGYRFVTVFFSVLQVVLLWWWLKHRIKAAKWQLIPILLSPGLAFFARSAIHETVFVFFMSLMLIGLLEVFHYAKLPQLENQGKYPPIARRGWIMFVWGLFGALALKETWVLLAASGFLAFCALWALGQTGNPWKAWLNVDKSGLFGHSLAALTGLVFLYTGWMVDANGIWEFFYAYLPWMKTGAGASGHEKSFFYWIQQVYKHEAAIAGLFVVGTVIGVRYFNKMSVAVRWLFLTSIIHFLAYSAIPYKTPWCLVALLIPCLMAVMAVWGELAPQKFPFRRTAMIGILALSAYTYKEFWDLNFVQPVRMGHEYVYVQTDQRLGDLMDFMYDKAKKEPTFRSARIQIAGNENWPMAWWMAGFPNHFHQGIQSGLIENPDMIIANATESTVVEAAINVADWVVAEFPIRDGRENSRWYLKKSTFHSYPKSGGYGEITPIERVPATQNGQPPGH